MRNKSTAIMVFAVTSLLVAAFVVLAKCGFDRYMRGVDHEAMRLGVDEADRRIRDSHREFVQLSALYNESAIASARSFARLIAQDPSLVGDRVRFTELLRVLGVDEIHVSDASGKLIASCPAEYLGYYMGSRPQSAAFMPAITNSAFELVQEPMPKGIDNELFQYAGVARIDEPGIVQVGLRPGRLESAASVVTASGIAGSIRVGRGGELDVVRISEQDGESGGATPFRVCESEKGRIAVMQRDVEGFRIVVTMPYRGWWLADDRPYRGISVFIVTLLVLILLGGMNMFGRRGFTVMFAEARNLMSFADRRLRLNWPLTIIAFAAWALLTAGTALVSYRSNVRYMCELIEKGEAEFRRGFAYVVDDSLFFVGKAIVDRYPTPKSFKGVDLKELLRIHGIDELNVVDGDGKLAATTMTGATIGQNQWNRKGPRQFNQKLLLDGFDTYSQPFRESASEPGIFRMYAGVAFNGVRGYVQLGFDEKRIKDGFDYGLEELADGWSIGGNGGFLLSSSDDEGRIISCGVAGIGDDLRNGKKLTLRSVGIDPEAIPADGNVYFNAMIKGEQYMCRTGLIGNYHRVIIAVPHSAIVNYCLKDVVFVGAILFVVLAAATLIFSRHLWKTEKDRRKRAEELQNAKSIQTESLPTVFPDNPDFSILARMDTAKEVGGDFYDFYTLPSGKQLFLIADTSGKGIPAAMFMMKAKAVIRAGVFESNDLAVAVADANNRLAENNDANMFVTAWIGVFDPGSGKVEFVNCGHNPPLIKHVDGSVTWVRTRPCLTLAAMPGARYRVESLVLERGESLFLYTDGVTEAMDRDGVQYGEARLEADLAAAPGFRAIEEIRGKVSSFVAGAEQSDDITMLSFGRKGV